MIVTKDKLLLLWPATKGYGLEMGDVCNSILVNTDFSIYLEFKVSKNELYNNEPIFIISKLPKWFSISIDKISDKFQLFTFLNVNGSDIRYAYPFGFEFDKTYELLIQYDSATGILYEIINGTKFALKIKSDILKETIDENSHILLGSGGFDYIKNYDIDFTFLALSKSINTKLDFYTIKDAYVNHLNQYNEYTHSNKYSLLGLYDFKEKTDFSIFDYTGNNNHLYIKDIENE